MKFPIPPEYCLYVNAFAKASTLRKAAALLGTDPAALVRKVKLIHEEHGLLEKVGNRWSVTDTGLKVAHWTEEMLASQAALAQQTPRLKLSAYSWLVEEMLIPNARGLRRVLKTDYDLTFRMAGTELEQELLSGRADFVLHGMAPLDPSIAHKRIASFPWVVITPYSWRAEFARLSPAQTIAVLHERPFCRHVDLSPVTALGFQPQTLAPMLIDSVVGLRAAVVAQHGWSAVPAMAVQTALADKKLHKLGLRLDFRDDFSLWWMRSRKDTSALARQLAPWLAQLKVQ